MSETDLSRRLDRLDQVVSADRNLSRAQRKQGRRAQRREREGSEASVVRGGAMVLIAVALAVMGVLRPDKWWLLFVALGLGLSGARQLELVRRRGKTKDPQAPEVERFEQACDQLLAELKNSPASVRDFLGRPEVTVEAIRTACRQLQQRQSSMLETVSPERAADLEQERTALEARLGDLDGPTYKRATDALKLRTELFHQVRASVERLASEQQILLTSLESLRMRVALARGAGADGASLGDMKSEVDRLSEELAAITDALEGVQTQELRALSPPEKA